MSATPVTLTTTVIPVSARAQLTAEQVTAFKALLSGSNLVVFPEGKTAADLNSFNLTVQPNGAGLLNVIIK